METPKMKKTKYHSWVTGKLPKGCQFCVKGRKEVVFITGVCPRKCFFCPISDEKKDKDVVYTNEVPVKDLKQIVEEARMCSSKGAGITGGDPLARLDRTIKVIKLLKKEFGKGFHIHLYTSLDLVSQDVIDKLENAGLDEIRFHPDIEDDKLWHRMKVKTNMDKGVEIPVIPGKEKEIMKLIDYIKDKVKFLNLNELEMADTEANKVFEHGFVAKDDLSYGVKGSEELAKKLLRYCEKNTKQNVHYCPVKLKDKVQMFERLKLRAKNVAKPYDKVTKDATLLRGAIYLPDLKPDFGYNDKVKNLKNKSEVIKKLKKIREELVDRFGLDEKMMDVDEKKLRLITSRNIVQRLAKYLKSRNLYPVWVEEDPTYDQFEVESEEV
ncbi:radical SAM protein [Candidatus Woesearchaeota archaeon]|nr:MAG: radical SAM protein [Candidatus Woesearchaeota archaeon]